MALCRGKRDQKALLSTSHKQVMSRYFLGSRSTIHVVVALGDKHLNNKCLPSSFLLAFIAECCFIWYQIYLWPVWVSCRSCIPSQPLSHPQCTGLWWGEGWRDSLDSVQALLNSRQTLVCYQHLLATKHSTMRAAMENVNSILARPNTYNIFPK